jgi:hypothetical protein
MGTIPGLVQSLFISSHAWAFPLPVLATRANQILDKTHQFSVVENALLRQQLIVLIGK